MDKDMHKDTGQFRVAAGQGPGWEGVVGSDFGSRLGLAQAKTCLSC